MLPRDDLGVELKLNPKDATMEVIVTLPAVHLTIRAGDPNPKSKKAQFRVKTARIAKLVLEYSDQQSGQPHLYRRPQEKPRAISAILWAPKGMRILIREAAAFYVAQEHRMHLFVLDRRDAST